MAQEILARHRQGETRDGIPNPSLETMCHLISKAANFITPKVQSGAFTNTGRTLATDGSKDHKLLRELSELFNCFEEDPVPREDFRPHFSNQEEIGHSRPSVAKIFRNLCTEAAKIKEEEFKKDPVMHNPKEDQSWA